jgi:hypothetical protein
MFVLPEMFDTISFCHHSSGFPGPTDFPAHAAPQSPLSALSPAPGDSTAFVSSNDALFDKCTQAAAASLLLNNDKYMRRLFNRHVDTGPPLALSAAAFKSAMCSLRAVDLQTGPPCARARDDDDIAPLPAELKDFISAARQSGYDGDLDLETLFLQFADVGGLLSFAALTRALAFIEIVASSEVAAAEQIARHAGAATSLQLTFIEFEPCASFLIWWFLFH